MPALTDTEIKRYIETDGAACPFCITCLDCNETWRELFHLAELQYPARADFAKIERP